MKFENYMILEFPSKSANESFARSAVASFAAQMDPTLEELGDIRTAVSEAVTNCIVHAYPDGYGLITMRCRILKEGMLDIVIKDKGVGIADLEQARGPYHDFWRGSCPVWHLRTGGGVEIAQRYSTRWQWHNR